METYYTLGRFSLAFAFVVQFIMLVLQASALRRHGKGFFVVLCIGTIFGLLYSLLIGLPYLVPLTATSTLFFLKVGLFFGVLGGLLAVIGTALLFRSYSKLSEALTSTPAGSA